MLNGLLGCDGGDYSDIKFIEEVVADKSQIRFDPSVTNKTTDLIRIDFAWTAADHTLWVAFCGHTNTEFELRGWASVYLGIRIMTVKQKVAKLKDSLMNGRMVKVIRDSIKIVEDMEHGFLFGMDRALPCVLHQKIE